MNTKDIRPSTPALDVSFLTNGEKSDPVGFWFGGAFLARNAADPLNRGKTESPTVNTGSTEEARLNI